LNFLAIGVSLVLGEGLTSLRDVVPTIPSVTVPLLSQIPWIGRIFFTHQSILVLIGFVFIPLSWYYINRTRPGLHLRAVGEYPAAADTLGIGVYGLRYFYVFVGGLLAGLAGATISLSISPGWFGQLTTAGQGWIAVGLVIFAQWNPIRAAFGAYMFGALRRLVLDIQAPAMLLGLANPFFLNPHYAFFLKMMPYAFTIIVLLIGSREAARKRIGSPAALGLPYIRGQRGL
jgi:simple sugar transport system permease protein